MMVLSDFNPRPPRGGRPATAYHGYYKWLISIHVLREEDDCSPPPHLPQKHNFNPRPPRGGRRQNAQRQNAQRQFQSTSSARRTTKENGGAVSTNEFQSTSSARRTTYLRVQRRAFFRISIHVLREEDDICRWIIPICPLLFQSTSSARRTTARAIKRVLGATISIHVLREEDDR